MENINPVLKSRIENKQYKQNTNDVQHNPKADIGDAELSNLKQDTLEIKKDKKSAFKKAALIGAGIGVAAGIIIATIKIRNLSKLKDELTKLYDDLFEEFGKTNVPEGLNFEKPKLVFTKLKKTEGSGYIYNYNEINIDPRKIYQRVVPKDLSTAFDIKVSDDLSIIEKDIDGNIFEILKQGMSQEMRLATKSEAMVLQGADIYHELTHARDFQMALSTEGGKEKIIECLKNESGDISPKDLEFIRNYIPQKTGTAGSVCISYTFRDNNIQFTTDDLIDSVINYDSSNKFKYYTNPTEINARAGEFEYAKLLQNGKIPRPKNISDEFINYLRKATRNNLIRILEYTAKHQAG